MDDYKYKSYLIVDVYLNFLMNVMIALLVLVTREVNPPQRREASQPLSCRKLQVLPVVIRVMTATLSGRC